MLCYRLGILVSFFFSPQHHSIRKCVPWMDKKASHCFVYANRESVSICFQLPTHNVLLTVQYEWNEMAASINWIYKIFHVLHDFSGDLTSWIWMSENFEWQYNTHTLTPAGIKLMRNSIQIPEYLIAHFVTFFWILPCIWFPYFSVIFTKFYQFENQLIKFYDCVVLHFDCSNKK